MKEEEAAPAGRAQEDPAPRIPPGKGTRVSRPNRGGGGPGAAAYRRGIDHRARGEEAEALIAFRAALAAGGLSPDERMDAERQSIGLRTKFGEVEVICDLREALVTIDGRPHGHTPLLRPILLRPGRHVLSISRGGYRTMTRTIDVPPGGRVPLRFSLPK